VAAPSACTRCNNDSSPNGTIVPSTTGFFAPVDRGTLAARSRNVSYPGTEKAIASFASPGNSDDTVVRVAYENAQTGGCTDGSTWRTTSY